MKPAPSALALAAAGLLGVAPVAHANDGQSAEAESELAARSLAQGNEGAAIIVLEEKREAAPHDPALLINLGIAYAHRGDDAKARALFEAALVSPKQLDLETADGNLTDSRRLARKALAMLERGEFSKSSQFSRR